MGSCMMSGSEDVAVVLSSIDGMTVVYAGGLIDLAGLVPAAAVKAQEAGICVVY